MDLLTLTTVVKKLSLHVLETLVCRGKDSNTEPSTCKVHSLTNCANVAAFQKSNNHTCVSQCKTKHSVMHHMITSILCQATAKSIQVDAALLRHALRRRGLIFIGICICDITKIPIILRVAIKKQ